MMIIVMWYFTHTQSDIVKIPEQTWSVHQLSKICEIGLADKVWESIPYVKINISSRHLVKCLLRYGLYSVANAGIVHVEKLHVSVNICWFYESLLTRMKDSHEKWNSELSELGHLWLHFRGQTRAFLFCILILFNFVVSDQNYFGEYCCCRCAFANLISVCFSFINMQKSKYVNSTKIKRLYCNLYTPMWHLSSPISSIKIQPYWLLETNLQEK